MAVSNLPPSFKSGIARWLYIKIKKYKHPLKPWKVKKVKSHKFDSGKLQYTLFLIIDKINEIVSEIADYKTVSEIETIVESYGYTTQSNVTEAIESHATLTTAETHTVTMPPSDRRLKYDVNVVGKSPSGINIYTFRFKSEVGYGDSLYQGVMADEVPHSVITKDKDGYDLVNYDKIDVNFVRINNL
tara:strand:- start:884 stop:1444 length:561 start_codon:yes stop_codon:yes gene_type:complete